jgi:hypothetical protein
MALHLRSSTASMREGLLREHCAHSRGAIDVVILRGTFRGRIGTLPLTAVT